MRRTSRSLRGRVRTSIVGVTALAVLLFAVPLGYALADGYRNEAVTTLQQDAIRVAATVSDSLGTDGSTVRLPADLPRSVTVGVYRTDGTRIAHQGPDRSSVAGAAADGHLHDGVESSALVVAAPVPSDGGVTLAVRVAQPYSDLRLRTLRAWALMALLGALVVGFATVLARRQASQIARPLERLTSSARALGDGDFTIRASHSGIEEADAAGVALEATARRLGNLLERERAFSADVSHQLRTPLTSLLLGLESALNHPGADERTANQRTAELRTAEQQTAELRTADQRTAELRTADQQTAELRTADQQIAELRAADQQIAELRAVAKRALRRAEQLRDTVDDLLGLARDTHSAGDPLDVAQLLAERRERWHAAFAAQGRRLTLPAVPDLPAVTANSAAVRQILDVLLANALTHGAGTASVAVVDVGTGISIEVADEGAGLHGDPEQAFVRRGDGSGHGIGLALARTLAEAEGGRLVVRRPAPNPVFSLLLPLPLTSRTGTPAPAAS
jgi:signal transduction histidine kinase